MAVVIDKSGARRADLAAIHVAKKSLGWDDDTYQDIMAAVCCVRSSAELDFTGRKRFLAHLRSCLEKQIPGAKPDRDKAPWGPSERRLWSLWQQLADADMVKDRNRPALNAWVQRQTGVDRLEWLNSAQKALVIDSAKRWLARKEVA